ncbi:MAG: hypothetical protein HQ536_01925 [Parcubacteria group bacterium]|nr:hypothetical protein [Parcubacteria group bacterium]
MSLLYLIMNKNKLTIIIKKPIKEVFEYTINPDNTHKWINGVAEEKTDVWPIGIGTVYINRGKNDKEWTEYEVIKLEKNKLFTLRKSDFNYYVEYTYRAIDDTTTELTYLEWIEDGNLEDPFDQSILSKLKSIMENPVKINWPG